MAMGRINKGDTEGLYLLCFRGVEEQPIRLTWDDRHLIILISDLDLDHSEALGRMVYFVPLYAAVNDTLIAREVDKDKDGKASSPWTGTKLQGLMLVSIDD